MDQISGLLRQYDALVWVWRLVVWVAAAYMLALGALTYLRPSVVHRFFGGLAASWSVNLLEAILRLIVGVALIGASPETRLPHLFFWFGVMLAVTSIPLMFLHRLHRRQASWVIPLTKRILPLMGIVAIALGSLIVWAMM